MQKDNNVYISSANKAFGLIFLAAIFFSILSIVGAATPNPGHDYTAIGGGVAQGDLLYGSAADTLSVLAKNTSATRYLSNTGSSNAPAWAQIDLSNGVTSTLPGANGGTGNAFMQFTGPLTSLRTFTLPNATATILTSAATVTVAQGGTSLSTLTSGGIFVGNGTGVPTFLTPLTDGTILQSNGSAWVTASGGVLIGRQTLTSGTSYTPTAGTKKILIRMWGGGGGGGGCSNVAGCAGGGGGAGGYAEYYFDNATGTAFTYAIGTAGTGNSGAAGGAGGATTFRTGTVLITANGGSGGSFTAGSAAIKFMAGGAGGAVSTNGHVNAAGAPGLPGMTSTVNTVVSSGAGGSTALGGAGVGRTNSTGAGNAAVANTGSGGGGASAIAATANAGGAGAAGIIIIHEFR